MTTSTQPTPVEGTQADRDVLARLLGGRQLDPQHCAAIRRGDWDNTPEIKMLARHRLASQQAAQPDPVASVAVGEAERLREALQLVQDAMRREDGKIVGYGWNITALNRARGKIHAALSPTPVDQQERGA